MIAATSTQCSDDQECLICLVSLNLVWWNYWHIGGFLSDCMLNVRCPYCALNTIKLLSARKMWKNPRIDVDWVKECTLKTVLHIWSVKTIWYALFVGSVSTDCAVFVDSLPAFRPAEVARFFWNWNWHPCRPPGSRRKLPRCAQSRTFFGLQPALTTFGGGFSIGSQKFLAN